MVQKLCTTNVVQNVVQTKVDWVLKQSLRMNIRKKNLCLKNWGPGGQKPKINTEKVKTRVFRGFLVENPKIKNF